MLWRIGFSEWWSPMTRSAAFICVLSVASAYLWFWLGQESAELGAAIVSLDGGEIFRVLSISSSAVMLHLVMNLVGKYLSSMLALQWRAKIVAKLHDHYFAGTASYWLNCLDTRVDNADQRITEEYVAVGVHDLWVVLLSQGD